MTDTPVQHPPEAAQEPTSAAALPWEDVTTEQFRMLRLVPLPVDRSTGARPLRFVQFGRAERHSTDLSLLRMDIQLPGQKVRKEQNQLDVWVDHVKHSVRIKPDTGLQLEPANRGLGRFMLAQAASWAQRKWSHYTLEGGELASKDALQPDVRERRDHALRTQGLDIEYADPQHLKGRYKPAQVGQMLPNWNIEKVQLVEILEAGNMLQAAEQNLQELEIKLRQQEEKVSKYKREDSGLRFTIACLIAFVVFQAGLLIWIATHR